MAIRSGLIIVSVITCCSVMTESYRPLFNETLKDINVVAGKTALLPCSVRYKGNHLIIWMSPQRTLLSHNNVLVVNDSRLSVENTDQDTWNLKIKHVQHDESGEYLCQINTDPVRIKRVRLHVQVPAHILYEGSSRNTTVKEGHDLSLTCKATGIPQPNITWFMEPLESKGSKEYLNEIGDTLNVRNIKRYQSGNYVCMAYNGVPPAVTRAMQVQVQYVPIITLLNTRLGQTRGKETILECSVTSFPRAQVQWLKDGIVMKHTYMYRMEMYKRKHNTYTLTLQIMKINQNDYGRYTCEAKNLLGTQRASMILYEYIERTTRTELVTTPMFRTTTYDRDFYGRVTSNNRNWHQDSRQYEVLSDGKSRGGYDYRDNDYRRDRTDYLKNSNSSALKLTLDIVSLPAAAILTLLTKFL